MRPNKLWIRPHDGAARVQDPGCQRSSCRSIPRGRGGDHISITSDIVKVEGEDSRHPRLSKGGQGEEGCRQFSIVGASSFARSWWNLGTVPKKSKTDMALAGDFAGESHNTLTIDVKMEKSEKTHMVGCWFELADCLRLASVHIHAAYARSTSVWRAASWPTWPTADGCLWWSARRAGSWHCPRRYADWTPHSEFNPSTSRRSQ